MYLRPGCFVKTVTTAGTAERLTTSDLRPVWVRIQPEDDNTDATPVYIGDSQVSSSNGLELDINLTTTAKRDSAPYVEFGSTMDGAIGISLKDIWVDAGTSTDGVIVFYLERVQED